MKTNLNDKIPELDNKLVPPKQGQFGALASIITLILLMSGALLLTEWANAINNPVDSQNNDISNNIRNSSNKQTRELNSSLKDLVDEIECLVMVQCG